MHGPRGHRRWEPRRGRVLALPTVVLVLLGFIPALAAATPWIDINSAMGPLMADGMSTIQSWQLVSAASLWIGLPMAVGAYRFRHREAA